MANNFLNRGSDGIEGIIDTLLKNKPINPQQRVAFHETSFPYIIHSVADRLKMEPEKKDAPYEAFIPSVITKMVDTAPKMLEYAGIPSVVCRYKHPDNNVTSEEFTCEEKRKFLEKKILYNKCLDYTFKKSTKIGQFQGDADYLGKAAVLESTPELRKSHMEIGESRLRAIEDTVIKNSADVHIFMKVTEYDGRPYAAYTAGKLSEAGAHIHNYTGGEKFLMAKVYSLPEDYRERLGILQENVRIDDKELCNITKIDKGHLENIQNGRDDLTFTEAKTLQDLFSDIYASNGQDDLYISHASNKLLDIEDHENRLLVPRPQKITSLLNEAKYTSFIHRKFPKLLPACQTAPMEPQIHKDFFGIIMDWPAAASSVEEYIEKKKVDIPSLEPGFFRKLGY